MVGYNPYIVLLVSLYIVLQKCLPLILIIKIMADIVVLINDWEVVEQDLKSVVLNYINFYR